MTNLLSHRIQSIKPSATLEVTNLAQTMRERGHDVISLSVGEPDFDCPFHVKKAAEDAIEKGLTKYTAVEGIAPLKKAIQKKFLSENQLSYELNEIIVTPGVKFGIYAALMATLNEGDEVIIPTPYWPSYIDMVKVAGGTPVEVFCPTLKLTPETLEKHITNKTKWVLLNSPCNPSGIVYEQEELELLANVVRTHLHVHVMSDEIYEHITFESARFQSFAHIAPDLKDRTLTLNGVSKAYAMTGWRIGYAGGPAHLIKAMSKLQSQSTSNPPTPSQYAALEALEGDQSVLQTYLEIYAKRRDLMLAALAELEGVTCLIPEGTFYVFPDFSKLIGKKTPTGQLIDSDIDLSKYFLEQVHVATVPGSAFGQPGHLRLSFATSEDLIRTACHRLSNAIKQLGE